jgi:PGF-CTERM protein
MKIPIPEEKGIPGFEVIFAIIGLLAMAYLLRRRKRNNKDAGCLGISFRGGEVGALVQPQP